MPYINILFSYILYINILFSAGKHLHSAEVSHLNTLTMIVIAKHVNVNTLIPPGIAGGHRFQHIKRSRRTSRKRVAKPAEFTVYIKKTDLLTEGFLCLSVKSALIKFN